MLWTYCCYSLLVWKPHKFEVNANFVPKFSQASIDSFTGAWFFALGFLG